MADTQVEDDIFTSKPTTSGETQNVETDLLSAMQKSLGKAMEELGQWTC